MTLIFGFFEISWAEINYDYKNSVHVADKNCVGVLSLVRDALFGDVNINTSPLKQLINPGATDKEFVREMTNLQNSYIFKYKYSRQFNDHYKAYKMVVKNRIAAQGEEYLTEELIKCVK